MNALNELMAERVVERPAIEYRTLHCPIDGCDWSLSAPSVRDYETFAAVMIAAEVLAHLTSRRVLPEDAGFPQDRLHSAKEIEEAGLVVILDAAGLEWDRISELLAR